MEVAIFTGAGRAFCCAGEDDERIAGKRRTRWQAPRPSRTRSCRVRWKKPVIAAVNGFATARWRLHAGRAHPDLLRVLAVRGAVFGCRRAKRWLLGGYNRGHIANLPYPIAMEMALGFRFTAERVLRGGLPEPPGRRR